MRKIFLKNLCLLNIKKYLNELKKYSKNLK